MLNYTSKFHPKHYSIPTFPYYATAFNFGPVLETLEATIQRVPMATTEPQKYIAASKLDCLINCPATGVPINSPSPPSAKHIPILVPTTPILGLNVTSTVGGILTKLPEKNP